MSGPFTSLGKEVLANGTHCADAATPAGAAHIASALNFWHSARWQDIAALPANIGRKMFVAIGVTSGNGFTGGRAYTTDPFCVWREPDGGFARWPHNWGPTHFCDLPDAPTTPSTEGQGE